MRGKLYESEYEEALIGLLQGEGWQYTNGKTIHRPVRETLLIDELTDSLLRRYPGLTPQDHKNVRAELNQELFFLLDENGYVFEPEDGYFPKPYKDDLENDSSAIAAEPYDP